MGQPMNLIYSCKIRNKYFRVSPYAVLYITIHADSLPKLALMQHGIYSKCGVDKNVMMSKLSLTVAKYENGEEHTYKRKISLKKKISMK